MRLHHIPYQEVARLGVCGLLQLCKDRKSTRLNSSHSQISYAVFCLKKKKETRTRRPTMPKSHPNAMPSPPHPSDLSLPSAAPSYSAVTAPSCPTLPETQPAVSAPPK